MEGHVPRQHLVEDDAQRVEVRLRRHGLPQRLLGGDVVGRPQHPPGQRQPLLAERAGDPEVGDLGAALGVDQDVVRLDVAMDDPPFMGRAERPCDLDRVGDRLRDLQRPARGGSAPSAFLRRRIRGRCRGCRAPARPSSEGSSPASITDTTWGWLSCATERASRRKRSSWSESVGDLAVHQLDRHRPLEDRVEGPVDRRHPPPADHGVEPVAPGDHGSDASHRHLLCAPAPGEDQAGQQQAVERIGPQRCPLEAPGQRRRALSASRQNAAERSRRGAAPPRPPGHTRPICEASARSPPPSPAVRRPTTAAAPPAGRTRAPAPTVRVAPLRETPGASASAWASPSSEPSSGPASRRHRRARPAGRPGPSRALPPAGPRAVAPGPDSRRLDHAAQRQPRDRGRGHREQQPSARPRASGGAELAPQRPGHLECQRQTRRPVQGQLE